MSTLVVSKPKQLKEMVQGGGSGNAAAAAQRLLLATRSLSEVAAHLKRTSLLSDFDFQGAAVDQQVPASPFICMRTSSIHTFLATPECVWVPQSAHAKVITVLCYRLLPGMFASPH